MSNFYLRSYQITLSAGVAVPFTGGKYFTIEESTADVDVAFLDNSGQQIGVAENVASGFWCEVPAFGSVQITSASAQTISVIIGGGSDSAPIRFGVNKTTTSINGGIMSPRELVTGYFYQAAVATLQTVVTPAANTAGVRIDSAVMHSASGFGRIMAKTSAPSSVTDTAARTIAQYTSMGASNVQAESRYTGDSILLPAGEGLYHQVNGAYQNYVSINYEVL